MYKIYTLNDPNTKEVRYVGYTSRNLNIRLNEHIRNSKYNNTHKSNWIKSLNSIPIIKLIKNVDNLDDALEMEKKIIKNHNNLTNSTSGGEKNKEFTIEIRDKISKSLKEAHKNGTISIWCKGKNIKNPTKGIKRPSISGNKNPFYGKKHTDETKKLISDKNRKNKLITYNELYDLYINRNMSQKDISILLNLTRSYVCRLMKKFDLVKVKKEVYGKIKGKYVTNIK